MNGNRYKHGDSETRFYNIWTALRNRCNNPNKERYKSWGGKGVKVCGEWNEYQNFKDDMFESYQSHKEIYGESNTTIDRQDNDGDYSPENCRWTTRRKQTLNKSNNHNITYKGETKTLSEWSDDLGINFHTLSNRLNSYGFSVEEAFENPYHKRRPQKRNSVFTEEHRRNISIAMRKYRKNL